MKELSRFCRPAVGESETQHLTQHEMSPGSVGVGGGVVAQMHIYLGGEKPVYVERERVFPV